jgi:hypothetical protein
MNIDWEAMMDGSNGKKEKRKFPRYYMDLPLEYRVTDTSDAYGGLVVDGSEIGLRIHSVKDIPVGTRLNVAVIFPKGFQMTNFEVVAEIVWKDLYLRENWNGYQYGLKFIQIEEEDLQKLQQLLPSSIPDEENFTQPLEYAQVGWIEKRQ